MAHRRGASAERSWYSGGDFLVKTRGGRKVRGGRAGVLELTGGGAPIG